VASGFDLAQAVNPRRRSWSHDRRHTCAVPWPPDRPTAGPL